MQALIAPGSIHAVITDPPYGSGGFSLQDILKTSKQKYVSSDAIYQKTLPDIAGDSLHPKAWEALMQDACRFAFKVLVEGGILAMFIDWRNIGSLQHIIHATGFRMRGVVVWDKNNGARPQQNGFRSQTEFLVWASKNKILKRDSPIYLPGVFRHSTITNGKIHITQKPLALMRDLVDVCIPGGTIFDPFMGSGTTGVAALKSGRKFIGCESVDQYFDTAKMRCNESLLS